jgi:hypothetical protein
MLFIFLEIRLIGVAWRGGSIYQEIPPSLLRGGYFSLDITPSSVRDQSLEIKA